MSVSTAGVLYSTLSSWRSKCRTVELYPIVWLHCYVFQKSRKNPVQKKSVASNSVRLILLFHVANSAECFKATPFAYPAGLKRIQTRQACNPKTEGRNSANPFLIGRQAQQTETTWNEWVWVSPFL